MSLSQVRRKHLHGMIFALCAFSLLASMAIVVGVDAEMSIYSSTGSGTVDDPYTDRFSVGMDPNSFTELDGSYFTVGTDFALKMIGFYTMGTDNPDFARMTDGSGSTYYMGILSMAGTISFTFEYYGSSGLESSTISIHVVEMVPKLVFLSDPVTDGMCTYKAQVEHPDNTGSGTKADPYSGTVYDPEDGAYVYASSKVVFDYGAGSGAYVTASTAGLAVISGMQASINTIGNYSLEFTVHNVDGSDYKTVTLNIVKKEEAGGDSGGR